MKETCRNVRSCVVAYGEVMFSKLGEGEEHSHNMMARRNIKGISHFDETKRC